MTKVGSLYYFCDVAKHCEADDMYGMINVLEEGATPKVTGVKAPETSEIPTTDTSGAKPTESGGSASPAAPSESKKPSAANIDKPLSVAVVGGVMLSLVNYCL